MTMIMKSDQWGALDYARFYTEEMGLSVIPIPHKKKGPVEKGWPDLRLSLDDLPDHFNGRPQNIGVLLGEPSGWVVDIDLDCDEARILAPKFLPETFTFGRNSSPRSHFLFRCVGASTEKFTAPSGKMLLECRSTNHQTVLPGSTHPEGERVEFCEARSIADIEVADLRQRLMLLATTSLLVREWPAAGSRNKTAMHLAGGLLRAGWCVEEVERFVALVAHAAGDEEVENRVGTVAETVSNLEEGKKVTGWPSLASVIGDAAVNQVLRWLDIKDATDAISTLSGGGGLR